MERTEESYLKHDAHKLEERKLNIEPHEVIKQSYLGKDLAEAAACCMKDAAYYSYHIDGYQIIAAKRLSNAERVEWEGRENELMELWQFDCLLGQEMLCEDCRGYNGAKDAD